MIGNRLGPEPLNVRPSHSELPGSVVAPQSVSPALPTPLRSLAWSVGRSRGRSALRPLEVLHFALVLLRRRARSERPEVPALLRPRVDLPRIEPVLASSDLPD